MTWEDVCTVGKAVVTTGSVAVSGALTATIASGAVLGGLAIEMLTSPVGLEGGGSTYGIGADGGTTKYLMRQQDASNASGAADQDKRPSLQDKKAAVKEAQKEVGGSLPKGKDGKFGSPQRGDSKKGYRLDPPHPDAKNPAEKKPHVNWWDYTKGKKGKGGRKGTIPIE